MEQVIGAQQPIDAETGERFLRADRLQSRNGKVDAVGMTSADDVGQNKRGGEIDLDDTGGFQHEQSNRARGGSHRRGDIATELLGVEKGKRRLKSTDDHPWLLFSREIDARRPPDRRSPHALEHLYTRARRAPYAVR